ncbi:hypothetical protein [Methylobacterium sp.]
MDRKTQTEAANTAVHAAVAGICAAGHDPQDVANVLFAYALKMMTDHNGQPAVARHLQAIGLQLANPHTKPFSGPPSRH